VTTRKCQNCPVRENQTWTILGLEREFAPIEATAAGSLRFLKLSTIPPMPKPGITPQDRNTINELFANIIRRRKLSTRRSSTRGQLTKSMMRSRKSSKLGPLTMSSARSFSRTGSFDALHKRCGTGTIRLSNETQSGDYPGVRA
jgi:hypothetical protein